MINPHRSYFLLLLIVLLLACNSKREQNANAGNTINKSGSNEWRFERTEGSILKFRHNREYNTNLYDLKYIGQVVNGMKSPFLIFSGRDCNECDANTSIYIHSPSNGKLIVENGENRYQYPGIETDYESDTVLYKARAFYGQVLPGVSGVIWYNEQLLGNNAWDKFASLVYFKNGIQKDTIMKTPGQIEKTLQLLKQGLCKEIKGIDYKSEP